ncbi:23S ribosomal RNA methyltransferase Erm [Leucobacter chinensis]|uniref:23S ribosomal RNA methyltransferase Erm n=1 Tax=Leucobacter chinensis TaxID=2851010 RepID=UPI001C235FA5|nr:23S ribosomal RNA methyltransferase Erm [Leucobacter chinensis]
MHRSLHGGRHELGQNFLTHTPTIKHLTTLVAATEGSIIEIGAGGGALTRSLATLNRPLTAIELDEHRAKALSASLPGITVVRADALATRYDQPVVVGNIPFHLTTPLLRRLLTTGSWNDGIVLTQWEVARKRAGVGGGTLLTAQSWPWFEFSLSGRVAATSFTPRPSVDGGILVMRRRAQPLVPQHERKAYADFTHAMFTGRGQGLTGIVQRYLRCSAAASRNVVGLAGVSRSALPRDLSAPQWASLWREVKRES